MNILEHVLLWLGGYDSYVVSMMFDRQSENKTRDYKSVCYGPGVVVLLLTVFSILCGYYLGAFLCENTFIRIIVTILVATIVFVTESLLVRSYVTFVNVLQSILSILVFSVLMSFSLLSNILQEDMQLEHDVMIEESTIYKLCVKEINQEQNEIIKYKYNADSLYAVYNDSLNVKWLIAEEIYKLSKSKKLSNSQIKEELQLIKDGIKESQQNSIAIKLHLLFVSMSNNSFISFVLFIAFLVFYSSLLFTKYYLTREFDENYGEFWDNLN